MIPSKCAPSLKRAATTTLNFDQPVKKAKKATSLDALISMIAKGHLSDDIRIENSKMIKKNPIYKKKFLGEIGVKFCALMAEANYEKAERVGDFILSLKKINIDVNFYVALFFAKLKLNKNIEAADLVDSINIRLDSGEKLKPNYVLDFNEDEYMRIKRVFSNLLETIAYINFNVEKNFEIEKISKVLKNCKILKSTYAILILTKLHLNKMSEAETLLNKANFNVKDRLTQIDLLNIAIIHYTLQNFQEGNAFLNEALKHFDASNI